MSRAKKSRNPASIPPHPRQLTVAELNAIAGKLPGATGSRGDRLEIQYLEGFYGRKVTLPETFAQRENGGSCGQSVPVLTKVTRPIRQKLKRAGFAVGSTDQFLGLAPLESKLIDKRMKRGDGGAK